MSHPKHSHRGIRIPTLVLIAISVFVAAFVVAAVKAPAHADRCASWGVRHVKRDWPDFSYRETYCRRRVRDEARVYAYERRWNDDEDAGRACRDVRKAVGDQHLTMDGAKKAANDSWAATVRFHIGEKWIDLNNARHITYTCSRSSIKEQGASITTLGAALSRCELSAQPCAPLPEHERRDER